MRGDSSKGKYRVELGHFGSLGKFTELMKMFTKPALISFRTAFKDVFLNYCLSNLTFWKTILRLFSKGFYRQPRSCFLLVLANTITYIIQNIPSKPIISRSLLLLQYFSLLIFFGRIFKGTHIYDLIIISMDFNLLCYSLRHSIDFILFPVQDQ